MDKNLWNILLLTVGGVTLGWTLFQLVAGKISGKQAGASVLSSLGCVLIGFSLMPGIGTMSVFGLAGSVCIMSGSLLTAASVRKRDPRFPPSGTGRIEGPHGDRRTPDG